MSTLAWGLAGALACFTAILTQPTQGFSSGDSFGPSLLLVALTGAVLARMQSLPIALFAGAAIGIIEQLLLWNYAQAGLVQLALFGIILVALLVQKQRVGRAEEKGSWAAVQAARPLPRAIKQVATVRLLTPAVALTTIAFFVLLPLVISNSTAVKLTGSFGFVILALSVGIITGLGGQLSLGQFAIGAIGAWASFEVSSRTGNFLESFVYAGLASAAVSVLIGIPALRVKGLLLTVTTLSFALVVPGYLLQQECLLGAGVDPGRPILRDFAFESGRSYYYVGLGVLLAAMLLARNVRSGGLGRRLVAVRDNEDAARAFTVPASVVKLQGFALAGFVAGIGGAMYGHSLAQIGATSFPTRASIDVVVIAVIGGLGLLYGPVLGAIVVQGATFLPLDAAGLAATALGQLLIIMYLPGGLGSLVAPLRNRIANALAARAGRRRRAGLRRRARLRRQRRPRGLGPPGAARAQAPPGLADRRAAGGHRAAQELRRRARRPRRQLPGPPGRDARPHRPQRRRQDHDLRAARRLHRPDEGTVRYAGRDITALGPEARGRMGLIRSFQDAALFPTLTVLECVQLSLERVDPTRLVPSLLGLRRQEKRKLARAEELVAWMGLERYRASQIQELSTGTRRITEIACLVALEPTLLLLDEPSSGVAQKETEALGALLVRLKAELGLTLIIIEHDIPLIMGLSDRIVCMADGEVIAAGTPAGRPARPRRRRGLPRRQRHRHRAVRRRQRGPPCRRSRPSRAARPAGRRRRPRRRRRPAAPGPAPHPAHEPAHRPAGRQRRGARPAVRTVAGRHRARPRYGPRGGAARRLRLGRRGPAGPSRRAHRGPRHRARAGLPHQRGAPGRGAHDRGDRSPARRGPTHAPQHRTRPQHHSPQHHSPQHREAEDLMTAVLPDRPDVVEVGVPAPAAPARRRPAPLDAAWSPRCGPSRRSAPTPASPWPPSGWSCSSSPGAGSPG